MFCYQQAVMRSFGFVGFLAISWMLAAAAAHAHTLYYYEKTISLTTDGSYYTDAGNHCPSIAAGAKGLHVANGLLYVPQNSGRMLQVVNPTSGSVLRTITHSQRLLDCWADDAGNVWAVDDQPNSSMWYAGSTDTTFTSAFTLENLSRAYTVTRDDAGNFYCTDTDGPVAMYDSSGTYVNKIDTYWAFALAVNPEGTKLYYPGKVSSDNPDLMRCMGSIDIDENGLVDGSLTVLDRYDWYADGTGIHYDPTNDNIFTSLRRTSFTGDNQIRKYDTEGNLLNQWNAWDPVTKLTYFDSLNAGIDANGLDAIYGVCTDPDTGKVYVSRHRVYANGTTYTNGDPRYDTQIVVFSAQEVGLGDANGDGDVDGEDAALLAQNWLMAEGALWGDGDFNYDGKVDDLDATILAANWTGTSASASVPEPSLLMLVAGGLSVLCLLRKRTD